MGIYCTASIGNLSVLYMAVKLTC